MNDEQDIIQDLETGLEELQGNPVAEEELLTAEADQFGEPDFLYNDQQDPGINDEERIYADLVESGAGANISEEDVDFGMHIESDLLTDEETI